jgi:hypothetical protein
MRQRRENDKPRHGFDNQRKAFRQIIARSAIKPHPLAILPRDDPEPSCLISCSHRSPEGGWAADVGRHGAMKPAGRARGRNDMAAG